MISARKKTKIIWALAALSLAAVVGCSGLNNPLSPINSVNPGGSSQNQQPAAPTAQPKNPAANSQQNNNPDSPASPSESKTVVYRNTQYGFNFTLPLSWQGYSIVISHWSGNNVNTGKVTETGPILSIRHPLGPSELGRNSTYVFALPARYNYAFPTGYKEVEAILANRPLQAAQPTQTTDPTAAVLSNM